MTDDAMWAIAREDALIDVARERDDLRARVDELLHARGGGTWRVGEHYGIHVYEGDRPVATFLTASDAALAVRAYNALPGPVGGGDEAAPGDEWTERAAEAMREALRAGTFGADLIDAAVAALWPLVRGLGGGT